MLYVSVTIFPLFAIRNVKHRKGVQFHRGIYCTLVKQKNDGSNSIRKRAPKQKVNDFLIKYSKNITSQCGEDGILEEIFRLINEFEKENDNDNDYDESKQKERYCAEFGCWDGKHLCNTHNLITNHGFKGILIEADSEKYKDLIENYKHEIKSGKVITMNEFVGFNDKSNCSLHVLYPNKYNITKSPSKQKQKQYNFKDFDELIDSLNISIPNNKFELIVIDIDGNDYHVFDSMIKYRSKVIIIEFNPTIPNNIIYIQPRDMNIQCGSSLLAIIELAKYKNYELVSTTTYNAIFVDKYYYQNVFKHRMPTPDNSIYKMHDCPMQTQIFQLYDGTLKLEGCKKLLWHKIKINEEKIQILPKHKRHFPFAPVVKDTNDNTKNKKKYVVKRKRKRKLKRINHSSTSSAIFLKAMAFIAVGFVLGQMYQKRKSSETK